jgi:hypothetical protein
MITEDYVSFETAKLLKEKGFHEDCKCQYGKGGSIAWISCNNGNVTTFARPTIQMTMKWLREMYKIFIEISVSIDLNGNYHYSYSILDKQCKYVRKGYTDFDWSYEQACEAGIKYCLENLI